VVSGLLSAFGPPEQIVELISSGDIAIVVDDRIVSEYADVPSRTELNLDASDVEQVLSR
jgi:hypothetical protein